MKNQSNFDLLSHQEISYILENTDKFGTSFTSSLLEYCKRNSFHKKNGTQPRYNFGERYNIKIDNERLFLKQLEKTRKYRVLPNILLASVTLLFFFTQLNGLTEGSIYSILLSILVIYIFISSLIGIKIQLNKIKKDELIKIDKEGQIILEQNGENKFKSQVDQINLYWRENNEAGDVFFTTLIIKCSNGKILIDEESINHLEWVHKAARIGDFVGKRVNIIEGWRDFDQDKNTFEF